MKNTEHPNDRLLTRSDVEDIFGVSRRYLEVAAIRGEGPVFVKIGRAVRYRRTDVADWIDACAVDPKAQTGGIVPGGKGKA